MAGGIDWFRWHHGSVTDPKFQLVARKAGARFGDVVTVWAFILENASADADRGVVGAIDHETLDFLLGAEGGTSARIVEAMTARGLIEGGRVAAWERRQPKREDEKAAERKRQQRERDEQAALRDTTQDTQCHADGDESRRVTPSHDREEESREEEKERTPPTPPAGGRVRQGSADPDGFAEWWSLYQRKDARQDAVKAWRQLNPTEQLREALMAALRVWRWNDRRELNPLPASWLRGRRWEDELVAKAIGINRTRQADWVTAAGFPNVYEANNAGCYEHNADHFRNGKRKEPA